MRWSRNTPLALGCALGGFALVTWALAQTVGSGASDPSSQIMAVVLDAAAFTAGAMLCVSAHRVTGRRRVALALCGLGCFSWGAGGVLWVALERRGEHPFPSWADLLYLGWPVLAGCGVLLLALPSTSSLARVRALLDGLMIALSMFLISWVAVLHQFVDRREEPRLAATIVTLAYPMSDIIVMTLLLYVAIRARHSDRRVPRGLWIFSGGIVTMWLADLGFVSLNRAGHLRADHLVQAGWIMAFVLMALAALHNLYVPERTERVDGTSQPFAIIMPYMAIVVAFCATAIGGSHAFESVVIGSWFVIVGALMVRQVLSLHENRVLARDLERRVTQRTRALEESERRLAHQAFHDSLTGLPNRSLFSDRLKHALERARRGADIAILFIDLDDFKKVNDTLGHSVGDGLLVLVAARLKGCVRAVDTVARLGGDEFAVLIEDGDGGYTPAAVAARVSERLRGTVEIDGHPVSLKASVGVASADALDTEEGLLQHADLAMYRAKALGVGAVAVYTADMHDNFVEGIRMEQDLRRAMDADEFVVHYQPVFRVMTREIAGFEALVRWNHPERGLLEPDLFIGLAEEAGLIDQLGRLVMREALTQLATWRSQYDSHHLRMSVNLSAVGLRHEHLVDFVVKCLAERGLPPGALIIEITESILVDDTERSLETLRRLAAAGVGIALDDFGTGYSSLSYLHRFPVDILKIDRSFVARLTADGGDNAFVRTIVALGRSLGVYTIAEGVETEEQLQQLRDSGCELAQGFLFSRPLVGDLVSERLPEWTARHLPAIPALGLAG